jgi:hypothetical protein
MLLEDLLEVFTLLPLLLPPLAFMVLVVFKVLKVNP